MFVNKKWRSRILFLPIFFLTLSPAALISGMDTDTALFLGSALAEGAGRSNMPTDKGLSESAASSSPKSSSFSLGTVLTLGSHLYSGLEMVYQPQQDALYAQSEDSLRDEQRAANSPQSGKDAFSRLEKLIDTVFDEYSIPKNQRPVIKKMSQKGAITIEQKYGFVGVFPTNSSLYINEDYLKTKSLDEQKNLIKKALKHYTNNSYTKMTSAYVTSAFVGGYIASRAAQVGWDIMSSAAESMFCTADNSNNYVAWYSPVELAKGAAYLVITSIIFNKTINLFKSPVHKYIKNTHDRFDKSH